MATNSDFTVDDSSSSFRPEPDKRRLVIAIVAILVSSLVIVFFLLAMSFLGGTSRRVTSVSKVNFTGKVISVDPIREGPVPETYHLRHHLEIDFEAPAPGWSDTKGQLYWDAKSGRHRTDADSMPHTMTVEVEDAKLLNGLLPGDLVEGEAKVSKIAHQQGTSTEVILTKLNKTK